METGGTNPRYHFAPSIAIGLATLRASVSAKSSSFRIGAPGSGKGTQSSRMLAARLGIPALCPPAKYFATPPGRKTLSEMIPPGAALWKQAGLWTMRPFADAVVLRIQAFHSESRGSGGASLILDGFPRTSVAQSEKKLGTTGCLQSLRLPRPLVLHLDVPNAGEVTLLSRLARRRQCAKCAARPLTDRGAIHAQRCPLRCGWKCPCARDGKTTAGTLSRSASRLMRRKLFP